MSRKAGNNLGVMSRGYKYKATLDELAGGPAPQGSSLKAGTTEVSGLMIALVVVAVLLMAAGFFAADNAITQTAFFAAAAVVAIFARIAQAGRQHGEMMDELRKR
jgi:hypothetical protein